MVWIKLDSFDGSVPQQGVVLGNSVIRIFNKTKKSNLMKMTLAMSAEFAQSSGARMSSLASLRSHERKSATILDGASLPTLKPA